jgi:hypothetical protein
VEEFLLFEVLRGVKDPEAFISFEKERLHVESVQVYYIYRN